MPEEVVYVLGTPGSNTVKIGRTTNLAKRVADIQRMSPVPLAVLWTHPGGSELESQLHRHFADRRCHGEWFAFDSAPLLAIQEAVEQALQRKAALPAPLPAVDSPDVQTLLRLIDEATALHLAKRVELEEVIAGARRAGCSLTDISEHTPFSREWVRRIADTVEQKQVV